MCGCTSKPALLRPVGSVGVFAVFEVEANFIEALLGYEVVILAQIATIDDGIDQLIGIGLEIATALDTPNSLEAQRVPYSARG